jgi:hypothetical protein
MMPPGVTIAAKTAIPRRRSGAMIGGALVMILTWRGGRDDREFYRQPEGEEHRADEPK